MTMAERTRPRWLAYLVTLFVAGAGHAVIGDLKRGAAWFALYALAVAFLSARSLSGAFDPSEPFFVTALQVETVRFADVAVPLSVLLVCLLDLWLRLRLRTTDS